MLFLVTNYDGRSAPDDNKDKKQENFIIRECKERAEIKEKSKQLKNATDRQKDYQLHEIELEHERNLESTKNMVETLESALDADDPEVIKELLRNMKV